MHVYHAYGAPLKEGKGKMHIRVRNSDMSAFLHWNDLFTFFFLPQIWAYQSFKSRDQFSSFWRRSINAFLTEPNSWGISVNIISESNGLVGTNMTTFRYRLTNFAQYFLWFKAKGLFELIDQLTDEGTLYLSFCGCWFIWVRGKNSLPFPGKLLTIRVWKLILIFEYLLRRSWRAQWGSGSFQRWWWKWWSYLPFIYHSQRERRSAKPLSCIALI